MWLLVCNIPNHSAHHNLCMWTSYCDPFCVCSFNSRGHVYFIRNIWPERVRWVTLFGSSYEYEFFLFIIDSLWIYGIATPKCNVCCPFRSIEPWLTDIDCRSYDDFHPVCQLIGRAGCLAGGAKQSTHLTIQCVSHRRTSFFFSFKSMDDVPTTAPATAATAATYASSN